MPETTALLLATVALDSGNEYVSGQHVQHPTKFFEGRVLEWGSINKSIPVPSGLIQTGDARIRIADTDYRFRNLFAASTPPQTPIDRSVEIRIVRENNSFAVGNIVYIGVITDFTYGDQYVEVSLHDVTFDWLDEEWPGFLEIGVYAPTIYGRCIQTAVGQHGLIPLPYIGFDLSIGDRWILAWHTVEDVVAIYRTNPDGTIDLVDPSEYSITEDDVTILGSVYTGTYIDFTDQQQEGTVIQADVQGWNVRPAWGTLPAASGILRNPIDLFINIMQTIQIKIGKTFTFDVAAIVAIRTLFATVIDTTPTRPYFCDGAILQSITMRALLSQFLTSFNLDLFQTVDGKISLSFMHAPNPGRTVYAELETILGGSYIQQRAAGPINRLKCKMARSYALEEWSLEQLHDNTTDQTLLGKIKAADLELWFVRDRYTATSVAAHRAGFLALDSYDQEFDLTLEVASFIDLCKQVGVTMTAGLGPSGFNNQEVRVDGVAHNLDDMRSRVYSRIYREQARNDPPAIVFELDVDHAISAEVEFTLSG